MVSGLMVMMTMSLSPFALAMIGAMTPNIYFSELRVTLTILQ